MTVEDVKACLDHELLPPPRRRPGCKDDLGFHQEHVDRLFLMRRCLDFGFSLQEIKRITDHSILLTCRDVYDLTGPIVERLRQEEAKTDRAAALASLRDMCPKVGSRQDCPILVWLHRGVTQPVRSQRPVGRRSRRL